jgi:hypothetical protein
MTWNGMELINGDVTWPIDQDVVTKEWMYWDIEYAMDRPPENKESSSFVMTQKHFGSS